MRGAPQEPITSAKASPLTLSSSREGGLIFCASYRKQREAQRGQPTAHAHTARNTGAQLPLTYPFHPCFSYF